MPVRPARCSSRSSSRRAKDHVQRTEPLTQGSDAQDIIVAGTDALRRMFDRVCIAGKSDQFRDANQSAVVKPDKLEAVTERLKKAR